MKIKLLTFICFTALLLACTAKPQQEKALEPPTHTMPVEGSAQMVPGAHRMALYLPALKSQSVAIVANQTSVVGKRHLVDTLLTVGVNIKLVFAPEHGFRGDHDAGEKVKSTIDAVTGLRMVSLYGANKKPSAADLSGVDVVVFDIQDVGTRFYTYISTLQYVMEACAENNKKVIVLDRPNPNGYYVDGPVLEPKFTSFVGMQPIPVVHGLTVGEYARMLNGEGWLAGGKKCQLEVIKVDRYTHRDHYQLPIRPSPNLPDMASVYLYPSLCFFEGTMVSVGRGTDKPFKLIGYPGFTNGDVKFTPRSIAGVASDPPYLGKECRGFDLEEFGNRFMKDYRSLYLYWLIQMYNRAPDKEKFFNSFFNKLAGNATLQEQIKKGVSEEEIYKSWQPEIAAYKKIRKKYLLYPDFE